MQCSMSKKSTGSIYSVGLGRLVTHASISELKTELIAMTTRLWRRTWHCSKLVDWLVGWEINVPFKHKNKLYILDKVRVEI